MPAKSIDLLQKVTVDLYKADIDFLKSLGAVNFAELMRKLLHDHVTMQKAAKHRMTLGDLKGYHYEGDTKVYHSYKDYADD